MSERKSKFTIGAGAVALAVLSLPLANADGSALKSMSLYGQATALSADPMYKWSAAVKRTDVFTDHMESSFSSAVAIAPDVFITAGHVTPRNGSAVASLDEVVFGANYNTSTDRYQVSHTMRYSGYVFGDPTTIDLGVGWTSSFISGFDTPIRFAGIPMGGMGTMVDYGNIGDPTTGEMPSLGDRMAGYSPRITNIGSSYPESRYDFFDFNGINSNSISLNVQALNASSGSPWWTADGALANLTIAKTTVISTGNTISLDLTNPEVQAFLQPIIQDSWARYYASLPEPTALGPLMLFGTLFARRKRA